MTTKQMKFSIDSELVDDMKAGLVEWRKQMGLTNATMADMLGWLFRTYQSGLRNVGTSTGPAEYQLRPSTVPARAQHGPISGPSQISDGPSTGLAQAQQSTSAGPTEYQHGPSKGPDEVPTCAHARGTDQSDQLVCNTNNRSDLVSPRDDPPPIPESSMMVAEVDAIIMGFQDPDLFEMVIEKCEAKTFTAKRKLVEKIQQSSDVLGEEKVCNIMDNMLTTIETKPGHVKNPSAYLAGALRKAISAPKKDPTRLAEAYRGNETAHPNNQGVPPPLPREEQPRAPPGSCKPSPEQWKQFHAKLEAVEKKAKFEE